MITNIINLMRTIIDIPDVQVKVLNKLSKKKKVSRAEIVRQALTNYITEYTGTKKSYKESFGIWKDKKLDSIEYQRQLRNEWK
jgi:metal-responsive CopG/Arc/MetJ family transcriptional regulator